MLSSEQIDSFFEDGFILIPQVYTKEEIKYCRDIFINIFKEELWRKAPFSSASIINDIYAFFPDLVDIIFNQKYTDAVHDLLGASAYWIPECSVHYNRITDWHKDSSEQELAGVTSHHDVSSPLLQVANYFQDNTKEGGGLTVIRGSHKNADHFAKMHSPFLPLKVINKLRKMAGRSSFQLADRHQELIDLSIKAGDLLIFDLRIDHRSTFIRGNRNFDTDKFAIFNTFGKGDEVTMDYFSFMKERESGYYRYFKDVPLIDLIYQKAEDANMKILY